MHRLPTARLFIPVLGSVLIVLYVMGAEVRAPIYLVLGAPIPEHYLQFD